MSTIDSKPFIDSIIRHNRFYNGDDDQSLGDNPRVVKVIEYTNMAGVRTWVVVMENDRDPDRYDSPSEYIGDPVVIWGFDPDRKAG